MYLYDVLLFLELPTNANVRSMIGHFFISIPYQNYGSLNPKATEMLMCRHDENREIAVIVLSTTLFLI
jgi:hypothetical protein